MKIGIQGFLSEQSVHPAALARKVEALGFESLFVPEHPVIPVNTKEPYAGAADGKLPEYYAHFPDPFVILTIAATVTSRIRLGTCVLLVAEHEPLVTAKQVATLDHYSGGRFIVGIGAGWLPDECEIMKVDFKRRWPMAREYVRAMKEVWTRPEASFRGEFISFPPLKSYPKPAQKPHPPVLVGAGGLNWKCARAVRDTVEWADGWLPVELSAEDLASNLGTMKKLCAERSRDFSRIEITVFLLPDSKPWTTKDPKALLREYEQAGAHRLILSPSSVSPDTYEKELEEMARKYLI